MPAAIGALTNLKELCAPLPAVRCKPASAGHAALCDLVGRYVHHTDIAALPSSITGCTSLEILCVRRCPL